MSEELQKIVDEYREKEIHISDEEAEQILWFVQPEDGYKQD